MLDAAEADSRWALGDHSGSLSGDHPRCNRRIPVGSIVRATLASLRPTQMAVGMRQVSRKLRKLEKRSDDPRRFDRFLQDRPIPAVYGPGGSLFIVDHHHLGLALSLAELEGTYVRVIGDASRLSHSAFWKRMEADGRLYLYDEHGRRVSPSMLPESLDGLRHDPYRDLAFDVRQAGGYDKVSRPYAEFLWANFFRERIARSVVQRDPKAALRIATKLARSKRAAQLPGYAC